MRLYESRGSRATARVTADFPHASVVETDLLERPLPAPVALRPDGTLALRPFQIVTLRFRRRVVSEPPSARDALRWPSDRPSGR